MRLAPEPRSTHPQSGRAGCKGACKQKIEKGALRFGSVSTASWDGEQTHYRKMACVTAKVAQNALAFYENDLTKLRGWDGLTAADQEHVREIFDNLVKAAPVEKPKTGKKKKPTDDDDADDAAPAPKKKKAPPKKQAVAARMPVEVVD